MKRCLWVVPKGIFPVRDGARVANQAMLKSIRPHFEELDIMLFNEDDSDELYLDQYNKEFNPTNVYFFKKASFSNKFKKLFFLGMSFLSSPKLPVTTGYFHCEKQVREVRGVLTHRQYDLIVFDGLHPYTAFTSIPEFKNAAVVYRAHNVEGDLWSTAASKTNNEVIKRLLLWQGKKMAALELELIRRSKKVWCISSEDLTRFSELYLGKDAKLALIPVGLDFKKIDHDKRNDSGPLKLLFLGKMDWAPNRDGLKWFLEEVWPKVDHAKFELHIVGSGDSSWGVELFKQPGIKFFGFVKDLDAAYAQCDFSIIPIRYGSGTRIKVIESISKGVPIVSTEMGVQGSGLTDYFKAESVKEWIETLKDLDRVKGKETATRAFGQLEAMYSPKAIGEAAYLSIKS